MTDTLDGIFEDKEELDGPLKELVEHSKEDKGAPFTPEVLEAARALKHENVPAFERLRERLKPYCHIGHWDMYLREGEGHQGRAPTQSDVLVDIAAEASLFHTKDWTPYADVTINEHRETLEVRSSGFRQWLERQYYKQTDGAPSSEAMTSTLSLVGAQARFEAPELPVAVRTGGHEGKVYLDLCDDNWRAVEIDANGWRIVEEPPLRFIRTAGMGPIPEPISGGSIDTLRRFLNVKSDDDFTLAKAWCLGALRDIGPYPLVVLAGEQGSAKSTLASILRALLDPNTSSLRTLPFKTRELYIQASNAHLLSFDNVSGLPPLTSDALCRIATGSGFSARTLYTDSDEKLFEVCCPIIMNGIEDVITRPDLADRAILLTLEPISEEKRKPEADLWKEFETERPRILGALLDYISRGIRKLPDTKLDKLPRMADFALWIAACESEEEAGTFAAAYNGNREGAAEALIEGDPVAAGVCQLMVDRNSWSGTASDLLDVLINIAGDRIAGSRFFPSTPRILANRLRRAATFLRKTGIEIVTVRGKQSRTIYISRADSACISSSPSSPSSPGNEFNNLRVTLGDAGDAGVTLGDAGASTLRPPFIRDKPLNSLKNGSTGDAGDAGDAGIREESAGEAKGIVWTREDWLAFYDNEARTAEWDNGETHEIAAATAFETCVTEYRNQYPSTSRTEARGAMGDMLG